MVVLCELGYRREDGSWKNVGRLIERAISGNQIAFVVLTGWVFGTVFGRAPHGSPHIHGDLFKKSDEYREAGVKNMTYQWCGYVLSTDRDKDVMYSVHLEVMPMRVESRLGGTWFRVT